MINNQVQISNTISYDRETDPLEKAGELLDSWKNIAIKCGLDSKQLKNLSCSVVDYRNKKHNLYIPPNLGPTFIRCSIQKIEAVSKPAPDPKESYVSLRIKGKKIKNDKDFEFHIDIYRNNLGTVACSELA